MATLRTELRKLNWARATPRERSKKNSQAHVRARHRGNRVAERPPRTTRTPPGKIRRRPWTQKLAGSLGQALEGREKELDTLLEQRAPTREHARGILGSRRKTERLQEASKQLQEIQELLGDPEGLRTLPDRRRDGRDPLQTAGRERIGLLQGEEGVEAQPVRDHERYTTEEEDTGEDAGSSGSSLPMHLLENRREETWTSSKGASSSSPQKNGTNVRAGQQPITESGELPEGNGKKTTASSQNTEILTKERLRTSKGICDKNRGTTDSRGCQGKKS